MELQQPKQRAEFARNKIYQNAYNNYVKLIQEISRHNPGVNLSNKLNELTGGIDTDSAPVKKVIRQYRSTQNKVARLVEQDLKLVPRGYYRNLWMVLGMSAFGIPMGVVFGMLLDNIAFIGVGMPFGMMIGIALGESMDQKAAAEGRQLDVSLT